MARRILQEQPPPKMCIFSGPVEQRGEQGGDENSMFSVQRHSPRIAGSLGGNGRGTCGLGLIIDPKIREGEWRKPVHATTGVLCARRCLWCARYRQPDGRPAAGWMASNTARLIDQGGDVTRDWRIQRRQSSLTIAVKQAERRKQWRNPASRSHCRQTSTTRRLTRPDYLHQPGLPVDFGRKSKCAR